MIHSNIRTALAGVLVLCLILVVSVLINPLSVWGETTQEKAFTEVFDSSPAKANETIEQGIELVEVTNEPVLVKEPDSPKIYLEVEEGVVAHIDNMETFRKLAPTNVPIKNVASVKNTYKIDAQITSNRITLNKEIIPAVKPVNVKYELVKLANDPKVYLLDQCNTTVRARHIKDWETFIGLNFTAENIKEISSAELQAKSSGPIIDVSNVSLKYSGENTYIKQVADARGVFDTEADLLSTGVSACDVIQLPPRIIPEKPYSRLTAGQNDQNFLDTTIYLPPNYGYGYGLPGLNQGFVAFQTEGEAIYRGLDEQKWHMTGYTPTAQKESLILCQKYFPGTYLAQAMSNYNFSGAWLRYAGLPMNEGWNIYACLTPPDQELVSASTKAVHYWYGKVDRVLQPSSANDSGYIWRSDPDGVSGGDLDTLNYCQKWFPQTQSVQYIGNVLSDDWKDRGLLNSHKGGGLVFECLETTASAEAFPVVTPVN